MAQIRTFIAIEIPEDKKAEIKRLQSELRNLRGSVRWVRPEGMHLTLKFLGDVEDSLIVKLAAEVADATGYCERFNIGITGTGAFPNFRRPRVFWIALREPTGELAQLAAKINHKLENLGFPAEKRKFSPHITLGRVKDPHGVQSLSEYLQSISFDAGEFEAKEIIIMKSQLKPTGAEYTPLHRIALESH